MELSWSTFLLEIVNFLVLVWILKRFLYKPVLDVIARRKAGIEKRLADARKLHEEAEGLQKQYEGRLAQWEEEQREARQKLTQELDAERAARMQQLRQALEQEREKARVAQQRRDADTLRQLEETAIRQGARFASQLLGTAAGPELHRKLVDLLLAELAALPEERIAQLRTKVGHSNRVTVTSAYPLDTPAQERLQQALAPLLPENAACTFTEDSELIAGLRIELGAWMLASDVRDELEGFEALAHAD